MAVRFETRLKSAGCMVAIDELRAKMAQLLELYHPGWNDEDLMHNPVDAKDFCDRVRQFDGCAALPDPLILRILSGARKHASE
jgi:hypothetical protein